MHFIVVSPPHPQFKRDGGGRKLCPGFLSRNDFTTAAPACEEGLALLRRLYNRSFTGWPKTKDAVEAAVAHVYQGAAANSQARASSACSLH